MNYKVIIPARYSSSRLPAKPLLDICGKPMILRVVDQVLLAGADKVIVATDDQRIFDAVSNSGSIIQVLNVLPRLWININLPMTISL